MPRKLKIHFELRVRRVPQSRHGLVRATHVGPDSFMPGQVPSSDWEKQRRWPRRPVHWANSILIQRRHPRNAVLLGEMGCNGLELRLPR